MWEPLNLNLLEERPPIQPTLGGVGLIYPGKRHVFSGPQETAKTLAAYAIALEEVRAGGVVLLLDFEMGQWDARDRLRELGASAEDFERIHYLEPEGPASEEIVCELIARWAPTLAIIDAAAGAYALQGLDDNKRGDVERFAVVYVRPFWLREIATILVDHVVKNADNRGRYAIGSERKVGSADVHLGFEAITALARGGAGRYKIVTHKDRGGWLPRPRAGELELRSDPDGHAITWAFKQPAAESEDGWKPTALMERVSRYLEGRDDPTSRNAVEGDVTGKRDYVRQAVDCLVSEGYVNETAGPNRARLLLSVQAFREDEFAPGSPRLTGDQFAPSSPREEPQSQADSQVRPEFAPGSPLAPDSSSPQQPFSPTGETVLAGRTGEASKTPTFGDGGYLDCVTRCVWDGHITTGEALELEELHKLVLRGRPE
jgi:hypothetical protein